MLDASYDLRHLGDVLLGDHQEGCGLHANDLVPRNVLANYIRTALCLPVTTQEKGNIVLDGRQHDHIRADALEKGDLHFGAHVSRKEDVAELAGDLGIIDGGFFLPASS